MLTYKSIEDYISAEVAAGRLFYVPADPGARMVRRIIVTPKIRGEIYGPNWSGISKTRAYGLQSELSWIVDGYEFKVALPNPARPLEPKPQAVMRQLHPGPDEVWEIRGTLRPPLRLFGRFAARDWFVALDLDLREKLPKGSWTREIANCQKKWNTYLPSFNPISGALNDYLSNVTLI